jgi:hypothetical protein
MSSEYQDLWSNCYRINPLQQAVARGPAVIADRIAAFTGFGHDLVELAAAPRGL